MKKSIHLLFLAFSFFLLGTSLGFGQKTLIKTIQHGGLTRDYRVYIPKIYDGKKAVPLLFNLHGFSSNEVQQEFYGDFRKIADTANFIIIHPRGTANATGTLFWNVGFFPSEVDDLGFINTLIDTISATYNINPKRIYSTGMSNGGFMSYSLACSSNRFAAIASVTGSITLPYLKQCKPSKPIPILEIHGTGDAVVAYTGTALFAPIDTVVNFWVKQNGCNPTPVVTNVPNIDTLDGATATRFVYSDGKKGTTVEHYKIANGAHTWPGAIFNIGVTCMDFSASKEVWRFFNQYSLITATEETQALLDFSIAPNPTEGWLNLSFEAISSPTLLEITDLHGKMVLKKILNDNTTQLDISSFANGFYVAKIQNLNGRGVQKFVKM
jgi:polyhydroxybutyrate depolymerase